ncbi:MAG: metallophosphoesterase family protein [Isosphaeraceae bacterium]|nr:metallophosphoesterase family protein [Isosphaeraceae bacterium]
MRILVVSDIHANRHALEAIREPHDLCICLGDLVDYGPDPLPCVRWAMEHARYAVRGNHDHGVAQGVDVVGEHGYKFLTRVTRPLMWGALGPDERRWLLQLPLTTRFVAGGKRFLLVHGTPRDPLDEYLMKDPRGWESRLRGIDADFVCVGHSHMQFSLTIGGTTVVNPGSVGQPRDGDPRAAYAVIEDGRVRLERVAYPIERTLESYEAIDELPDRAKRLYREVLTHGRMLKPASAPTSQPNGEGE